MALNPNPPHRVERPVMFQSWNLITFLHWRYDASVLQSRLPMGLEVDTFDGIGWVSLTPFLLEDLRPPLIPALPWLSRFPEMNLRTYVTGPAGAGIWFFSLDAARLPAVLGARLWFGLPYHWAHMWVHRHEDSLDYCSLRGRARARIGVKIGEQLETPDDLAIFLTARYRLYSVRKGKLFFAEVEHLPWKLFVPQVHRLEETVRQSANVMSHETVAARHYSHGVSVRIGPLKPV